jgi:hypothetical protein
MLNVAMSPISLLSHPSTPTVAVESLDVQVSVPSAGLMTLVYSLRADMSRVRVRSEVVPAFADNLWKQTCFEAFIQPIGSHGYFEFNFSPTRQWAVYRFDSYREGMTPMGLSNPLDISVRREPELLVLEATFPLPVSAAIGAAPHLKLALSAVVEEDGGTLSYWSARHPKGRPDFHHPDGFAFEL